MTKTVTIAATRANGDPYAHHDVIVTLVAGSAGGVVGSNVVVEQSTVKLDADGEGSIVLATNDVEVTDPPESFYRFTVAGSSPTITRSLALTDDLPSTVSWSLADIQVGDPVVPQRSVSSNYVTVPGGGSLTNQLDIRPVLATADWWTEASNRFATIVPDRSRWAEHGTPAVTPTEIPDGTYLMGETISDPDRPRVPDHARLEFPDGVRIMWRANHGLPNGWQPMDTNPTGYSDIIAHQALEDDGLTDALEAGLRKDPDDDLVRGFVDEVTAGEDPEAPAGDTQTFSDPLDPEHYEGVCDFCMDITWSGGTRTYEFYVPNPTSTDLLTPGEAVEAWELHSTTTRTAGPGFYASGLPWYLGDSMVLTEFVRMFDLGTGDLAFDFQATEAVAGGWTDEAGNPWTHGEGTTPHVVTAPDDLILLPSTTIPSRAANPGAGDWTLMFHGVLNPSSRDLRAGTAGAALAGTGWGLYSTPPEYGGVLLAFNDGDHVVSSLLGITDTDPHIVIARLNRTDGTLDVTVDGTTKAVTGDPGDLDRIDGAEDFTLAIGTVLRGLAVWSRCLTDDEAAALDAETRSPADRFDPVGAAGQVTGGGGVSLGETSTTAYRGDRGKTAYDHSQVVTGNPHGTTAADVGAATSSHNHSGVYDPAGSAATAQAYAIQRGNHTGTQAQSTVTNLTTDLAAKAPTSRTITAGTGLTGGGDLSADRTLAVVYGTTSSTAAEGISVVNATWRTGSYYGPSAPRVVNAGQTLASGEARAMPFYNPVAGRTIDQLAVDVQSGSAGTGTLYVCTDDGTGYPGTVVASGAFTTPVSSTRMTASVSYGLLRGLLWLVAHGTGTTWSGLSLDGQSTLMPVPAAYSTGGISCWRVTGAGATTFTSFPSGGSLSTGVLVLMRSA